MRCTPFILRGCVKGRTSTRWIISWARSNAAISSAASWDHARTLEDVQPAISPRPSSIHRLIWSPVSAAPYWIATIFKAREGVLVGHRVRHGRASLQVLSHLLVKDE
jgi:hypothetical protein